MRPLFQIAALIMILLLPSGGAFAAAPQDSIESLHTVLLQAMKAGPSATVEARYALLKPKLDAIYDFRRMIEVAAGSTWANTDAATQNKLADAFARFSVMTYASRFGSFAGEEFRITGERPGARDTVLVDTEIDRGANAQLAPGENRTVTISYVMAKTDDGWRIIDVILDQSISELALRRSEYSRTLRSGGADQLIEVLNKKSDELAAAK